MIINIKDIATVCKDEELKVKLGMRPNLENRKDLLIKLQIDFEGKRGSLKEDNDYVLK